MKHTVILANFNGERFLEETIASVLAQKDCEFELILVDDASTDSSAEIMREYSEAQANKIKLIKHAKNLGQGGGFNTGFSHSKGEMISFIDSDDVWYPDKLKTIEATLTHRPEVALLHHNLHILRNESMTDDLLGDLLYHGDLLAYWNRTGLGPEFAPTSALSIPRPVLSKCLPMPEMKICADSYLARAAMAFGPVHAEFRALGAYRKHQNNNFSENAQVDAWTIFRRDVVPPLDEFYDQHKVANPFRKERRNLKDRILDASLRGLLKRLKLN
ncbi:MAG: glycosyltransferase [Verrucomicrobiota bacterium]